MLQKKNKDKLKVTGETLIVSKDWMLLALKRTSELLEMLDVSNDSIDLDKMDLLAHSVFISLTNALEGKVNIDLIRN